MGLAGSIPNHMHAGCPRRAAASQPQAKATCKTGGRGSESIMLHGWGCKIIIILLVLALSIYSLTVSDPYVQLAPDPAARQSPPAANVFVEVKMHATSRREVSGACMRACLHGGAMAHGGGLEKSCATYVSSLDLSGSIESPAAASTCMGELWPTSLKSERHVTSGRSWFFCVEKKSARLPSLSLIRENHARARRGGYF